VGLRGNPLFETMLQRWFATFQNTHRSTIVNGLEFLTALALTAADGKLEEKAGAVFDIFDFDDEGAITRDELGILVKSAVRGLSKATKGLGPRLAALCPMSEVAELTRQCFVHCDLDDEQDLPRARFILWVKQTPKIVNLLRCFVQREYLSDDEAAVVIQRCGRGMLARREAAERRLELQLEVEQELSQAAQKIQDVVVTRKKKRERLRQQKVEQFAHHGAVYSFGANTKAQLGHANMELTRHVASPLLAAFFKNNELRISRVALSETHASAVASDGQVFTWGAGVPGSFGFLLPPQAQDGSSFSTGGGIIRRQPTRVDDLNDVVIVDSRLGSHHSVALSAGGVVYTWGSGGYGQLGHGDFAVEDERSDAIFRSQLDPYTGREYPVIDLPLQLDPSYFEEMRVTQVACGYYFTLVVTEDGSVFSWGEGSDGQLGLGYSDAFRVGFLDPNISGSNFVYIPSPTRVDALKEPIDSVAVGGNHVFAVGRAPARRVFEWGAWKRRGATDARDSAFAPLESTVLSALSVHQIAAGKEHALAVTLRVQVSLTVDQFPYRRRPSSTNEDAGGGEDEALRAVALCARFGSQPAQLSRAISGSVFAVPLPTAEFGGNFQTSALGSSSAMSAALSAAVYNRSDSHLRSSIARCTGKIALLDRGTSTGFWISMLVDSTRPAELLEIPCVPAALGPPLSATGVRAQLFYSPERLSSLRLYVRPDEVVGRIAVLEFGQDDVAFDADALDASELIGRLMHSLVALVKDAQDAGAAGVVVIFDFLEADAFALEVDEEEGNGEQFTIPAVMIRKSHHGDLLLEQLRSPGKRPWTILSYKEDVLGKQVSQGDRLVVPGCV
jgi:alpha-tubulin suppressor-like RCC1 family protein